MAPHKFMLLAVTLVIAKFHFVIVLPHSGICPGKLIVSLNGWHSMLQNFRTVKPYMTNVSCRRKHPVQQWINNLLSPHALLSHLLSAKETQCQYQFLDYHTQEF